MTLNDNFLCFLRKLFVVNNFLFPLSSIRWRSFCLSIPDENTRAPHLDPIPDFLRDLPLKLFTHPGLMWFRIPLNINSRCRRRIVIDSWVCCSSSSSVVGLPNVTLVWRLGMVGGPINQWLDLLLSQKTISFGYSFVLFGYSLVFPRFQFHNHIANNNEELPHCFVNSLTRRIH